MCGWTGGWAARAVLMLVDVVEGVNAKVEQQYQLKTARDTIVSLGRWSQTMVLCFSESTGQSELERAFAMV